MKTSTPLIILFLSIAFSFSGISQNEDYDAVYQKLSKSYTLNANGSIDFMLAKSLKLQTYRSFNRLFGETFVIYDPAVQKLKINEAYTVMADGKNVVTPKNAFNKVLPRFARNAPAFNPLREMVITHTGLEIGSTINLEYTVETQAGFYPALMGTEVLAETQPIDNLTISVKVPQGKKLYYHLFNSKQKPKLVTANGFTQYSWEISSIPAISSEGNQKSHHGSYPTLVFSTLNSYQELVNFFNGQEAFSANEYPPINKFITELSQKKTDPLELIFALQDEVVKNLRLFPVPEEYVGYRLRTPEEVWKSNGGTVAEKAVLLTSMLRKAGIPSAPVLVFNGNTFDKKVGNLTNMEEWIVQAEIPGKEPIYLSVEQVNAFDMSTLSAGQVFMILNKDGSYTLNKPAIEKTMAAMVGVVVLNSDNLLTGNITGELAGRANPYLALLRNKDKIKHYFSGFSSSTIVKSDLIKRSPQKTAFTCQVKKKSAMRKDSNFYFLSIPLLKTGVESTRISSLFANRTTPIELSSPIDESYTYTIIIPEELTLLTDNIDIQINNQVGSFNYLVKQTGKTILVVMKLEVKQATIIPEEYSDFKELMDSWNLPQTGELIFQK